MTTPHPRHELDETLVHPIRFSIAAALFGIEKAEFGLVRDSVEITDSALSKNVALLETAGYVEVEKGRVGRKPCTWLSLTDDGTEAYRRHLGALQKIVNTQNLSEAT